MSLLRFPLKCASFTIKRSTFFTTNMTPRRLRSRENFTRRYPSTTSKRYSSTFCLFSYVDRKFSFKESDAREYTRKAAQFESISVDPDSFINDLQESICIMLRDGDQLAFLHRPFQEYFTALFLANRERLGGLAKLSRPSQTCCLTTT
jgi:hypothetical protein